MNRPFNIEINEYRELAIVLNKRELKAILDALDPPTLIIEQKLRAKLTRIYEREFGE